MASPAARVRVLLIFSARDIGGAERSLTRMAIQGGQHIDYRMLTVGGEGAWSAWARTLRADVETFDLFAGPVAAVRETIRCLSSCRRFRPDIVYMVGLRSAVPLRLLRMFLPAKFVHAIRSSFPTGSGMRRKFALVERLLHGLTDHYVANSQTGARDIQLLVRARGEEVSVIYNGVTAGPPIAASFASRPPRVVVVANITGQKGHLELLPVIRQVRGRVQELQVCFVGRNDMGSALGEKIAEFGLTQVVSELGFIDSPDAALRSARVFALPTLEVEGCPTAIIEAMAIGLPVVAYAVGGIPEIIRSGHNGVLVAPGDEQGFAAALERLLVDAAWNEQLGRTARMTILDTFSIERCAAEHARLWHRLSARTAPRSRK